MGTGYLCRVLSLLCSLLEGAMLIRPDVCVIFYASGSQQRITLARSPL